MPPASAPSPALRIANTAAAGPIDPLDLDLDSLHPVLDEIEADDTAADRLTPAALLQLCHGLAPDEHAERPLPDRPRLLTVAHRPWRPRPRCSVCAELTELFEDTIGVGGFCETCGTVTEAPLAEPAAAVYAERGQAGKHWQHPGDRFAENDLALAVPVHRLENGEDVTGTPTDLTWHGQRNGRTRQRQAAA